MPRTTIILLQALYLLLAPGLAFAQPADSVYLNGSIYTLNDKQTWAEALAVREGRFIFVGDTEQAKRLIGADTEVIDLEGRMVMPGIHDAHSHMVWGGLNRLFECRLPLGASLEAMIATLRECETRLQPADWLVAGSAWSEQFPGARFNRKYFDEAFPERPVYVFEGSQHHAFLNTRALAEAGISATTASPAGGRIVRDDQGLLTGELVEAATVLASANLKSAPAWQREKALLWASQLFSKHGITSTQESSANEDLLQTFKQADEAGALQQMVAAHIIWGSPKFARASDAEMEKLIDRRAGYASPRVAVDYVKMWIDGSPTPPFFTEGSIDFETEEVDLENILIPPARLNDFVVRLDRMGIKLKLHVAGAGAAHVALDAVAAARKANPDSPILHELGHTNLLIAADFPRMKSLNVVGDMSPTIWHLYGPTLGNPPLPAWQFRTLHENGVLMTMGTDWPVTDDPNMFPALQGLLDRGYESLPLDVAIRMMTINGAISMGWQERLGSIENNKTASFIILDRNLFEVEKSEIAATRVLRTVFEGRTVYQQADD